MACVSWCEADMGETMVWVGMENMVNDGLCGMEERKVFSLVVGARRAWSGREPS